MHTLMKGDEIVELGKEGTYSCSLVGTWSKHRLFRQSIFV